MFGRLSTPDDSVAIVSLMRSAFSLNENIPAFESLFLRWKYWGPHPLEAESRGRVIESEGSVVGHGCVWPIGLQLPEENVPAFHLIDWAADRNTPGAGMQAFRQTAAGRAAAFSIGGTQMTRKILPAFGFKPLNTMYFLWRPLSPFQPASSDTPMDWKAPARVARNLLWWLRPRVALPEPWSVSVAQPDGIPDNLWPKSREGQVASYRSAALLAHAMTCPTVRASTCALLRRKSKPVAYFLLVQSGNQVRMADYGPADLDTETAQMLGVAAQQLARSEFRGATSALAVTSETAVREGLLSAGFRERGSEPIKVLKQDKRLKEVTAFRLTQIDWDSYCL